MDRDQLLRFVDQSVSDGRSALFQVLVNDDSQASGAQAAVHEIERQIAEQNDETHNMVGEAATLSDLARDLKVADVVFPRHWPGWTRTRPILSRPIRWF
jgi:hypothetical protein